MDGGGHGWTVYGTSLYNRPLSTASWLLRTVLVLHGFFTHADLTRMRNTRKENFICVPIVKRDKRTQNAGHYPGAGHAMRDRAYNFSVHFRVKRGARTVL
jgi:hypothetical protein